jgi:hypothetical protein
VTRAYSAGDAAAGAFSIAGGGVFVFSLAYAAWAYAVPFGVTTADSTSAIVPVAFDVILFTVFALHHSL